MTRRWLVVLVLAALVIVGLCLANAPTSRGAPDRPGVFEDAAISQGLRGTPAVPEVAQLAERHLDPDRAVEVAGSNPVLGGQRAAAGAPQPRSEVPVPSPAGSLWSASATWCAPTPTQCQSWDGDALLAALPTFRWGDAPFRIRVSRGSASVVVTVVSRCWCGVDLSKHAFAQFADPSRGRIEVIVEEKR